MILTLARRLFPAAALALLSGPLVADGGPLPASDGGLTAEFLGRLRALKAPAAPIDMYADEKSADLAGIRRQADLFDPAHPGVGPAGTPIIALFTGPNCADCEAARAELQRLAEDMAIRAVVLDVSETANAAMMAALDLDMLPSYVMPDRLIRGHMPAIVLRRYLSRPVD